MEEHSKEHLKKSLYFACNCKRPRTSLTPLTFKIITDFLFCFIWSQWKSMTKKYSFIEKNLSPCHKMLPTVHYNKLQIDLV